MDNVGTSNPLANEEARMKKLTEKVLFLEKEVKDQKILLERLKGLVAKTYDDCFPTEPKCESEVIRY